MKTIKYVLASIALLFIGMIGVLYLEVQGYTTFAKPRLQEQDFRFMNKIRSNLDRVGETVRVADIHPGSWEKVCASRGGVYFDFTRPNAYLPNGSVVINNNSGVIEDLYGLSIIFFVYSPNNGGRAQIETYRSISQYMTYASPDGTCVDKENAYLRVKWNEAHREKPLSIDINRSPDYMAINLINLQKH